MPEIWIQIENRPWDLCPNGKDRMSGMDVKDLPGGTPPVDVTLHSTTGHSRTVKMYKPVRDADGNVTDALILRRYKPPQNPDQSDAWTVPDDRKVNPWDLNELDPGENGTMGTIPGPVIECNFTDQVIVHFRNNDMRTMPPKKKESKTVNLNIEGDTSVEYPADVHFPPDPHIKVGDTVVWHNKDGWFHTVTADGGAFDSSPGYPPDRNKTIQSYTGTWSHKFTKAGTFPYHCKNCELHGTITVS